MATKKRRIRSPHPGVILLKPRSDWGHKAWRARFTDPDSKKETTVRLDPLAVPTAETRRDWAVKKSKAIAKRRMEIESGAPLLNRTDFESATADYLTSCKHRLRPKTIGLYEIAIDRLTAWAMAQGIRTTADLSGARLAAFREWLVSQRKQVIEPGGRRGKHKQTSVELSPHTVNWQLRAIKSMLNHWRLLGLLTQIDRDAIGDTLKPLSAPKEQIEYLDGKECRLLIEAALAHDEAVYAMTREEHDGLRPVGSTRRYEKPISPFVAFLLLTGCRIGEALSLD